MNTRALIVTGLCIAAAPARGGDLAADPRVRQATSVALMQLRDEGRLRLDDAVEKHLPWFKVKQMYPESGPITIESLLTHSAGFQEDPSFPYWTDPFEFPSP
ncbi:MAG TPA: serine hydrolase domain-containing protein [Longimicrobiaceae bacterium]|nr:serine hydrolase domain-containing protein [Longimicrobiaceae bacterium]